MTSAVIKFSALFMYIVVCAADNSEVNEVPLISEFCLDCICHAETGCRQSLQCEGSACGLFRISEPYWIDAGKPTVEGQPLDSPKAFSNCAINPYCAARTVQGYMRKFGKDCNGDGVVNCYDYMAMHKLGAYGCVGKVGSLPFEYVSVFNQCVAAFVAQQPGQTV